MFRVVTAVEPNLLFMLCDNRNCSFAATSKITDEQLAPENYLEVQTKFLSGAIKAGWTIGLDAQICPECSAKQQSRLDAIVARQKQLERDKQLVQIADPGTAAKMTLDRVVGTRR